MKIMCFWPSMMLRRRIRISSARSLDSAEMRAVLNLLRASASSVDRQFSNSLSVRAQLHSIRTASSQRRFWFPVTSENASPRLMLAFDR